ncbi:hypothetical protein VTJ04DRAFT_882 [Mycothermus thermophilus]|uniref:uncharacterized protein n=1 Tax=Humicola insolens TaxID=85995 RepID=UPI0037422A7C
MAPLFRALVQSTLRPGFLQSTHHGQMDSPNPPPPITTSSTPCDLSSLSLYHFHPSPLSHSRSHPLRISQNTPAHSEPGAHIISLFSFFFVCVLLLHRTSWQPSRFQASPFRPLPSQPTKMTLG